MLNLTCAKFGAEICWFDWVWDEFVAILFPSVCAVHLLFFHRLWMGFSTCATSAERSAPCVLIWAVLAPGPWSPVVDWCCAAFSSPRSFSVLAFERCRLETGRDRWHPSLFSQRVARADPRGRTWVLLPFLSFAAQLVPAFPSGEQPRRTGSFLLCSCEVPWPPLHPE
jgi:hypothetical protein